MTRRLSAPLIIAFSLIVNSCSRQDDSLIRDSIRGLIEAYPEATLQDIYKSSFQDVFGPGHIIASEEGARNYLQSELASTQTYRGPLYEQTIYRGNFYRANLSMIAYGGISEDDFFAAFMKSAGSFEPVMTQKQWTREWNRIVAVASEFRDSLPSFREDSLAIAGLLAADEYAAHHSESYSAAYDPHYRIISKEVFESDILPVLDTAAVKAAIEASREPYDWTPEQFKVDHPDEWNVVKHAIDEQQKRSLDGEIDFGRIDALVMDYMEEHGPSLPQQAALRIRAIEKVCRERFDISEYDTSNMGMAIADGTRRLFEDYVKWLYRKEAVSDGTWMIDKEMSMFREVSSALYDVCDTVAHCFDGSMAWTGWSQLHELDILFEDNLYKTIIGADVRRLRAQSIDRDAFVKECELIIQSEMEEEETVRPILDRFQASFLKWYDYRKENEQIIADRMKGAYRNTTDGIARMIFIHMKNRFGDIGPSSDSMAEIMLKDTDSDRRVLEYCYEDEVAKMLEGFRSTP